MAGSKVRPDVFMSLYIMSACCLTANRNPQPKTMAAAEAIKTREQAEKELVLRVLEETIWNRKQAARRLNICYKALLNKLKRWQIDNRRNAQTVLTKPSAGKDFHPLPF